MPHEPLEISQVMDIATYFPIGGRVTYYPEYQSDLTMESVILGYEINDHQVYLQNQLEIVTAANGGGGITLLLPNKEYQYSEIESFSVLLPGNAGEEGKLSYPRKASLGARGQFRNGNSIMLVARYQDSGVIMLETSVRESVVAREGVYKGHQLALLEVLASTLEIKEQRTQLRLKTSAPIRVRYKNEDKETQALLIDYSELNVQIDFGTDNPLLSKVQVGAKIRFTLNLDNINRQYDLGGTISHKRNTCIVVSIESIMDQNEERSFELMDALDVKAGLLQHPQTQI